MPDSATLRNGRDIFYADEDLLPLSALQHLLFCERQCALIHVEKIWVENRLTAEGRVMHEKVHEAGSESRGDMRLKQVQAKGFKQTESGAVEMDDETRKTLLVAYQKRKQEEIKHPFLGESLPIGLLMHVQALLLARCLRGDLDGYPPFIWK